MTKRKIFTLILVSGFITLNSYLFITAPEPLKEVTKTEKYSYSVNDGFRLIARINDEYRACYTRKIVGDGKKVGFKFDENWLDDDIEAGPLPALFLRSTAAFMEKDPIPLGLYLGSDFPISESNLLTGIQAEYFESLKQTKQVQFFFDNETSRHIAMFPDFATVNACVSCHNQHPDSPKKDWKINDLMGATTWTFPHDSITTNELIDWINLFINSANHSYSSYLHKTETFEFSDEISIGTKWPEHGKHLPTVSAFTDTVLSNVSVDLIKSLINENH